MNWSGPAIILSARAHGEGAAIVQVFAREAGRTAGLVHGRRNKTALLQPGNLVEASWRARLEEHLGVMTLEIAAARTADALADRAALAALNAACSIALTALPERDPHPQVFDALDLVLSHLGDRTVWPALYVRWEVGLLSELGFRLELDACAMTGTREDLVYVSPTTGKAASRAAGAPYAERLLALPKFLANGDLGNGPSWADIAEGLALTGHFLDKRLYAAHNAAPPEARGRLVDEITRLVKAERAP
jgi:DNA repair protein RecO (recombination protein O)